jgi:hypothetical protein
VRLAPLLVLLAITGAVVVRDPHAHGSWGLCPTYALSGFYCPGCGSLRALHDLGTGHWLEAVGHNALVIPAILFAGYCAVRSPGRAWAWIWLLAFAVFTLVRNLPGNPLAP